MKLKDCSCRGINPMCNRCNGRGTYYVEFTVKEDEVIDLTSLTNKELINKVKLNVCLEECELILLERGISRERIKKLTELSIQHINETTTNKEIKERETELEKILKLNPIERLFPKKKKKRKIKSKSALLRKKQKALAKAANKLKQAAEREKQKNIENNILKKSQKQLTFTPFGNLNNLLKEKDK